MNYEEYKKDLMEKFIQLCKKYDIKVTERREDEYPEIEGAVFLTPEGPTDFAGAWEMSNRYIEEEMEKQQESLQEYFEKNNIPKLKVEGKVVNVDYIEIEEV